jgi:hypothetical protein
LAAFSDKEIEDNKESYNLALQAVEKKKEAYETAYNELSDKAKEKFDAKVDEATQKEQEALER